MSSSSGHIPITSTEIGTLWLIYQEKTMIMRFLEYFIYHVEDPEIDLLLQTHYNQSETAVEKIRAIYEVEGAAIPAGFTKEDVHPGAPKLYDFLYDIMYLHMMSKVEIGMSALFSSMTYRKDITQLYKQLTAQSQDMYEQTTQLLLEKGVLARPPYVTMPKKVTFVQDNKYMSGFNPLNPKRSLNTIEISLIHNAIETNLTGMQLMIGFAQSANLKEVRDYFVKGMKLAKKIEITLGEFLRGSYIEPPATGSGKTTDSTVAPFSDKLMMYNSSVLTTFGLGSNALGGAFSLRSDLPVKMMLIGQDIYDFAKQGGKIMVKNGWMEEPPQAEDREKLTSR